MTHLNLDMQPEVIRQFVLELTAAPEGVVLESAGRALACLVPPPNPRPGTDPPNEKWTDEKNQRRSELLDRKYDHGLSPAEEAELTLLQDALYRHIDRVAPLSLEAARTPHQELLRKAARVPSARVLESRPRSEPVRDDPVRR